MSATTLKFPKQSHCKRVWVHNYREGDLLPEKVVARRIDCAPPLMFDRALELLTPLEPRLLNRRGISLLHSFRLSTLALRLFQASPPVDWVVMLTVVRRSSWSVRKLPVSVQWSC